MSANKKFEKIGVNPAFLENEQAESKEHNSRRKVNVYSFRKATPKKKREKQYEIGFINVYILFSVCFVLCIFNNILSDEGFYNGFLSYGGYIARCSAYFIIFIVPSLLYCKLKKDAGFGLLGVRRFSSSYTPFIILSLLLMAFVIAAEKFALAYFFSSGMSGEQVALINNPDKIWIIITYAIVPSICEELLLRGVLQNEISRIAGGASGIIVSALAFALIHLDAQYFIIYFSSGLILAVTMHVCSSVIPCIFVHLLNNLFSLCFSSQLTFIASERVGNLLILIILTACIFIISLFWIKNLEILCIRKAASVEISLKCDEDDVSQKKPSNDGKTISFYSVPFTLMSDTGYTFHKFLRVLFSPTIIISVIIFLFATL